MYLSESKIDKLKKDISSILGNINHSIEINIGRWNTCVSLKLSYQELAISEIESGCGALILSGYYGLLRIGHSKKDITDIIRVIINTYNKVFITTIGETEYLKTSKEILTDLGFKPLHSYINLDHSYYDDIQTLMIYVPEKAQISDLKK